ncbi:hypothetical protein [Lysobacter arvi]|uniref:Uncharacterized protein n=1 Tax=Lysobacter arvi TaxID=3038776 RepID=A0ABU1CDX6_9GAMM|nr:hypothetical protein [Lysobacter arvi]MDR0182242.1 hypothetical protein [Lysobacter arvi]
MDQRLDLPALDPSLELTLHSLQACTFPAAPVSFADLIAASLREACEADGDTVFPIIARLIDQHIAGALQPKRIGRWRDEALDDLLSVISPGMRRRAGISTLG